MTAQPTDFSGGSFRQGLLFGGGVEITTAAPAAHDRVEREKKYELARADCVHVHEAEVQRVQGILRALQPEELAFSGIDYYSIAEDRQGKLVFLRYRTKGPANNKMCVKARRDDHGHHRDEHELRLMQGPDETPEHLLENALAFNRYIAAKIGPSFDVHLSTSGTIFFVPFPEVSNSKIEVVVSINRNIHVPDKVVVVAEIEAIGFPDHVTADSAISRYEMLMGWTGLQTKLCMPELVR